MHDQDGNIIDMSGFSNRQPLGPLANLNQQSKDYKTRLAVEEQIKQKSELLFRLWNQMANIEVELQEK